jgi:formylglycine-generating enzyme required for sulfatase activity
MMAAAGRRHLTRLGIFAVLLALGTAAAFYIRNRQQRFWQEEHARATAEQLLVADTTRVPALVDELDALASPRARALLNSAAGSKERSADELLRAQLFLAGDTQAARQALFERITSLGPEEHRIVTARLKSHAASLAPQLWEKLKRTSSDERLLRAAAALAAWDPNHGEWADNGSRVADALVRCANKYHVPAWVEALVPIQVHLIPTLTARFRDETASTLERSAAATALARFHRADGVELARLALDADSESFPVLFAELQYHSNAAAGPLRDAWSAPDPADPAEHAVSVRRRANAAVALARLGDYAPCWSALAGEISPDVRTGVIDRCPAFGVPQEVLRAQLDQETNVLGRQAALIALAEYGSRLTPAMQTDLREYCLQLYERDPHSGIHAAAEWTLRRLDAADALADVRRSLSGQDADDRDWYVNRQGITMVIVRGPREFMQGSPAGETERDNDEATNAVRLPLSYAISSHEITLEQFQQFQPKVAYAEPVTSSVHCPVNNVSWIDAAKYCRWLSETEGIPENEMCYPPLDKIDRNMKLPDDWSQRTGYRLPTEAEWECACRADTNTARFFGQSGDRLDQYGFYLANSNEHLWPVGSLRPNPWGLFDVYGNVLEWCQDSALGFDIPREQIVSRRVLRSGHYRSLKRENRSAKRFNDHDFVAYSFVGLRVARTVRH